MAVCIRGREREDDVQVKMRSRMAPADLAGAVREGEGNRGRHATVTHTLTAICWPSCQASLYLACVCVYVCKGLRGNNKQVCTKKTSSGDAANAK